MWIGFRVQGSGFMGVGFMGLRLMGLGFMGYVVDDFCACCCQQRVQEV